MCGQKAPIDAPTGVIALCLVNISTRANTPCVISAKKCLQCSRTVLDCSSGSAKGVLQTTVVDEMTTTPEILRVYRALRDGQQLNPVDAVTEAAQWCGVDVTEAAAVVRAAVPADAARLWAL